jgi:hypothetical protein
MDNGVAGPTGVRPRRERHRHLPRASTRQNPWSGLRRERRHPHGGESPDTPVDRSGKSLIWGSTPVCVGRFEGMSGSSDVSVDGSLTAAVQVGAEVRSLTSALPVGADVRSPPARPGQSGVLCWLPPGVGRISSRIGGKILPSPAQPSPAQPAGRSPGARSRPPASASATTGTGPARGSRPWADVGHSLTRSVSRRVLAAERGIAGIALVGEWGGSGQRRGIAKPATPTGRDEVWRTSRPSQSPRRRDRPRVAFVLASL